MISMDLASHVENEPDFFDVADVDTGLLIFFWETLA
jgi:hypothetical protein